MSNDQIDLTQQAYMPEFLPRMDDLQNAAAYVMKHAAEQLQVGQMIVSDLRRSDEGFEAEIQALQRDCMDEIEGVKRRFQDKVARIQSLRERNTRMIEFYVGQVAEQQPVQLTAAQPQRPKQQTMLQKLRLA